MSLIARLLGSRPDPREALRPLWHSIVALSRDRHWYVTEGAADSVSGRFDMIAAILALVLLRMEKDPDLAPAAAYLTELFVEDMDGQLRESGVGDLMVGKHVGKLVGVLGGRLGAFREGLEHADDIMLAEAVERNITMVDGADPAVMAATLRNLYQALALVPRADLLDGRIPS